MKSFALEIAYRILNGFMWLIRVIPYRVAITLGRSLSTLAWAADPLHRKTGEIQMRAALGSLYRPGMSLQVFKNHSDIFIDAIRYAYMDDQEIRQRLKVEGRKHLEAARRTGRGIMLITGHIGNWEILAHIPRIAGVEFCVMADKRPDPHIESLANAIRSRSGATILPPKGKALMLIHELKKGRTSGFLIDNRGTRRSGIFCNVFDMPAITNPAPAVIAINGDAMIVPVYAIKQDDSYCLHFEKPVDARSFTDNPIQQISDYMQSWVESVVWRYPDQWFWLYSRWIHRSEMRKVIRSGSDFKQYVLSHNTGSKS